MDTLGFTWNWVVTIGTNAREYNFLCFKGVRSKVRTFTGKTTTGTQNITGLGFKPRMLWLMTTGLPPKATAVPNFGDHALFSFGAASSPTDRVCIWAGDENNVGTTNANSDLDRTKIIKVFDQTPTLQDAADLLSFDDDGFSLDWTTASGTGKEIIYMAWGDPVPSVHVKGGNILGAAIL
jgi:hypothetical protein